MIQPYNLAYYRSILIEKFEVSAIDFAKQISAWQNRLGNSMESEKAFLWQFLEKWAQVLSQKCPDPYLQYKQLQALYRLMWSYLIGEQKKGTAMMEIMNYLELKIADLSVYKTYVTIIGDKQCAAVEALNGMTVSLENALLKQPIPYDNCSRQLGCICCYGIHAERNPTGRLIRK
ncbi:MAG: hypothetical protein JST68_12590 [Bacteroidetes bacterium]|nr:hypothetical protein [Bacteroidota bacterium]